jgi:hypothetical protein
MVVGLRGFRRRKYFILALCLHYYHQPINVPAAGEQAFRLHIRRTGHNPPREPSADWWVLTTNAAGTFRTMAYKSCYTP